MTTRLLLFLCTGLMAIGGVYANSSLQPEASTETVFDWLSTSGEVLEVTLESDWTNLIENRKEDLKIPASFSFTNAEGVSETLEIDVTLRGKFRRRVCAFPPVKLKFSKKDLKARGLNDHNDIKLVTHCLNDKKAGNENVLREYLTYKMYKELTDNSYRVQLVKITYVDAAKKMPKVKRYGFIIEDTDEMAERLGGEECDCLYPKEAKVDETLIAEMAMFQYLVGNEDWNLPMGRNLKYVILKGGQKAIPVAYDFDFSGLVNTSYALPNSDYSLLTVQDRIYIGNPVSDEILGKAIQEIKTKRSNFINVINSFELLSNKSKKEMIAYLDSCYDFIAGLEKAGVKQWYSVLSRGPNSESIPLDSSTGGQRTLGK